VLFYKICIGLLLVFVPINSMAAIFDVCHSNSSWIEDSTDFMSVANVSFNKENEDDNIIVATSKAKQGLGRIINRKLSKVINDRIDKIPKFYLRAIKDIQKDVYLLVANKYLQDLDNDDYFIDEKNNLVYASISLSFFDKMFIGFYVIDSFIEVSKKENLALYNYLINHQDMIDILEDAIYEEF
jgi:hypothetical protein